MKLAIIFAVAFVALSYSETADGSPFDLHRDRRDTELKVCEPGETKMKDCNRCFCVADGSGWGCTKKRCIHRPVNVAPAEDVEQNDEGDNSERAKRLVNGSPFDLHRGRGDTELEVCEPGETKMEDCNSCFCGADGFGWSCTRMECVHTPINIKPGEDVEQNDEGDNSERVKRLADGSPFDLHRGRRDTEIKACKPGETKMEDCNRCFCVADGSGWGCTRMGCIHRPVIVAPAEDAEQNNESDNSERVKRLADGSPFDLHRGRRDTEIKACKPGDTKMEDCNRCFCVADGSGWGCTRMGCIHRPVIVAPAENAEQNNESDNSERTKRQATNIPGFVCEPNSHYMDDCNSCHCSPDGTFAACTLMACLRDTKPIEHY